MFRSSIARPAHTPSYSSLRGSPHAAQGLGFLGVDSSQGRPCFCSLVFTIFSHLLLPTGFDRRLPSRIFRLEEVSGREPRRRYSCENHSSRPHTKHSSPNAPTPCATPQLLRKPRSGASSPVASSASRSAARCRSLAATSPTSSLHPPASSS